MKDFLILIISFACVLLFSCAIEKKEQIIERDIPRFYEDINLPVNFEIGGCAFKEGYYRSCVEVELKAKESLQYSLTQGRRWEEYAVPFEVCSTAPLKW